MRISSQSAVDTSSVVKASESAQIEQSAKSGSDETSVIEQSKKNDNNEYEEKLQQAVKTMNKFLEINQSSSKFVYHEGLEKYYVTVIDKETEEVIKEIPPKKLLDAFYEMQKLVGMIVDEKI